MMTSVNIHEAKTHFSQLINEVEAGGQVTISRAGNPVAALIPYHQSKQAAERRIGFGRLPFKVPDDFDTMMADEIEEMFYGSTI
jgi:prevent-host-death family protein